MKENRPSLPRIDFYLLIPYYDNFGGLLRSLRSVNYQPSAYALLIVDDGSPEPLLAKALTPHLPEGVKVEIVRLTRNEGITKALNTGLQWLRDSGADFRYVARLDCGDLCMPDRFTKQVGYLDAHPKIDLAGSWCIFSNFSSGASFRYKTPTQHKKIARSMYFRNIFIHPTVMWRASVAQKAIDYPEKFPFAEDYGFFYEIISKGEAAILPETLVICEINPNGLSLRYRMEQLKSRSKVVQAYGRSRFLRFMGIVKVWMLMVIPYRVVFRIKKWAYGTNFRIAQESW